MIRNIDFRELKLYPKLHHSCLIMSMTDSVLVNFKPWVLSGHSPDCDHLKPPSVSYFWVDYGTNFKEYFYHTDLNPNRGMSPEWDRKY